MDYTPEKRARDDNIFPHHDGIHWDVNPQESDRRIAAIGIIDDVVMMDEVTFRIVIVWELSLEMSIKIGYVHRPNVGMRPIILKLRSCTLCIYGPFHSIVHSIAIPL